MSDISKEIDRDIVKKIFFIGYINEYLVWKGINLDINTEGTIKKHCAIEYKKKDLSEKQIRILNRLKKCGVIWKMTNKSIIISYLDDDLKKLERKLKLLTILDNDNT